MLKVILMISICRAIVNPGDFDKKSTPHIDVRTGPGQHFVFTIETDENVSPGTVAFSLPQRKWATLSLNQEIGARSEIC